jgi:hypothetical protein
MVGHQHRKSTPPSSAPIPLRDKAAIAVILVVVLGALAYAGLRAGTPGATGAAVNGTPIFAGLPAGAAEANAAFHARVLADFPLHTPEDQMVQALSQQGFKSDGWFSKRMTFRRQHGLLRGCDFTASVNWESDNQARISALDARFLGTPGCADSPG